MYSALLFIHSWTRWIVVAATLYFLVKSAIGWSRGKKWTSADNHFIWIFSQVFGYQILIGLTIYLAVSPMVRAAVSDPGSILSNGVINFWTLRHPLSMILAFVVYQVGEGRAKKGAIEKRYAIYTITFAAVFAIMCSAIPWDGLSYGRPYFRWGL